MDLVPQRRRQEHRHRDGGRARRTVAVPAAVAPRRPRTGLPRTRPSDILPRRSAPSARRPANHDKTGVGRMSYELALPLILVFSIGSLFVAGYLMQWVLQARHRHGRDAGDLQRHQGGRRGLPAAPEQDDRRSWRCCSPRVIFVLYGFVRGHHDFDPVPTRPAAGLLDHPLLRPRRGLLGRRRLRRHVDLDPHQHPHGLGRAHVAERRAPDRAARRRGLRPLRRRDVAPRRRRPLLAGRAGSPRSRRRRSRS